MGAQCKVLVWKNKEINKKIIPVSITDNDNGSFTVKYEQTLTPGKYTVEFFLNDQQLKREISFNVRIKKNIRKSSSRKGSKKKITK